MNAPVRDCRFYGADAKTVVMPFIHGESGKKLGETELPINHQGIALRLFDYLTANADRRPKNWMRTPDGRIVGIDHALCNFRPRNPSSELIAEFWNNGVSHESLLILKPKLQNLAIDFHQLGMSDKHETMMTNLSHLLNAFQILTQYAVITKGDVPGHDFHGNQWTNAGTSDFFGKTFHHADITMSDGTILHATAMPHVDGGTFAEVSGEKNGYTIEHTSTDGGYGQTNYQVVARDGDGEAVGTLSYSVEQGDKIPHIQMVETEPRAQGNGLATAMYQVMAANNPKATPDPGMLTDDGAAWWNSPEMQQAKSEVSGLTEYKPIAKGDVLGHAFHGNQYEDGAGGGEIQPFCANGSSSDAVGWLDGHVGTKVWGESDRAFTGNLTPEELSALREYTGDTFRDINAELREHDQGITEADDSGMLYSGPLATNIQSAIDKSVVDAPVVAFRGLRDDVFAELQPGDEFRDPGFSSTSMVKSVANAFAGDEGTVARIEIPAGSHAVAFTSIGEGELLLGANSHYTFNGYDDKGTALLSYVGTDPDWSGEIKKAAPSGSKPTSRFVWNAGDIRITRRNGEIQKGDSPGHDFHGNQYTSGYSSGEQPRKWSKSVVKSLGKGERPIISPKELGILLRQVPKLDPAKTATADITELRVNGTNLMGQNGLGFTREEMPQIPTKLRDEFTASLAEQGITSTKEFVDPTTLQPSQSEIGLGRVSELFIKADGEIPQGKFLLASQDNYIIDGHHNWAADVAIHLADPTQMVPIIRVNAPATEVIARGLEWSAERNIASKPLGKSFGQLIGDWWNNFATVIKGDVPGHPFHGNQYQDGEGGGGNSLGSSRSDGSAATLIGSIAVGKSVNDWLSGGDINDNDTRGWAKELIAKDIAARLDSKWGDQLGATPSAREEAVSQLISEWANTSNDASATSLAIQEAAVREFGLTGTAPWDCRDSLLEQRGLPRDASDERMRSAGISPQGIADEVDRINGNVASTLAEKGELYQAFLRAQYDATQEFFKSAGITEVSVYRGMKLGDLFGENLPKWADVPPGTNQDVPLRPLSSFSYSANQAWAFGETVISGTVPVERVLSCATSGFGCLSEKEVVVMSGSGQWQVNGQNDFSNSNLAGADLSGQYFVNSNFSGANLTSANLADANLKEVNLSGANLTRVELSDANLSRANLTNTNLSGANLIHTNLHAADLSDANLIGANLTLAGLNNANLGGANLEGANFSNAYLATTNLNEANLNGTNFTGAKLPLGFIPPGR